MKKILKYVLLSLSIILTYSCYNEKKIYNRSVDTEKYGKMLLGRQTKSQLKTEPFNKWYDEEYKDYEYDTEIIKELKNKNINSYDITVFFGTWCGDSHRELPRLIKILDAVNYPEKKLNLVGVNRKKETPDGEELPYKIQRIPTIILKKSGKEVGRIVESTTTESLEKDLLQIIKKK